MTIQITPIVSRYVLTTGYHDGEAPQYYTGRGGENWLGAKPDAWTSLDGEAAKRKCETLNRLRAVHGFTFWIVASS